MVQDSDVQAVRGMGEKIRAMKADGQFDTAAFKSAVAEMEARKAELTPALVPEIGKRKMDNAAVARARCVHTRHRLLCVKETGGASLEHLPEFPLSSDGPQ